MNLDRYAQTEQALYVELAATVKFIIEKSIAATGARPPQSIQCRAKSAASLRPKLEARGLLHSESVEKEIKDLAGVRLIFYTNTDVDRFLDARLIPQGFEVDWNETRIHHPTSENAQQRYQAIHYTVYLSAERLALPEYAKFRGMRCEIQIQTILNHAWAETSHDILYKKPEAAGFGARAFEAIKDRMNQVMDDYLLPAGYELQKVQHDFERLMQGKALFDRGTLETLAQCDNNNDRHDTLSEIREYVLPNYDDIKGIYPELCTALADAVKVARASVPKPIQFTFGTLPGKTAEDIATIALNILDELRYVDVERTFHTLAQIYCGESTCDVGKHVLQNVKHLAAYSINTWQYVGPSVQYTLAEMLGRMTSDDRLAVRPLGVTVWSELLSPEMRGTSAPALDKIVISVGPVLASDALSAIRERAITGLFELWEATSSETQLREVFSALTEGMRTPTQGSYSNHLLATILNDATRIINSLADRLSGKPYELLQDIEHQFLLEYRRARHIADDPQDRFACREVAMTLMTAILAVRDRLNADEQYVRYKTLVGFNTALPPSWEDKDFDFHAAEQYRQKRARQYIEAVNDSTEEDWYRFISLCAATESHDLATFRVFREFLVELAKAKPATAIRLVRKGDVGLMRFLTAFLNGLSQSAAEADYRALLADQVSEGKYLAAIAQHYRTMKTGTCEQIRDILNRAIKAGDDFAVIECLALAISQAESPEFPHVEHVFVPAIKFMTDRKSNHWVDNTWFMDEAKVFFNALSAAQVDVVLENLLLLPKIDHCAERILVHIAEAHPRAVWEFFGRRLDQEHHPDGERYEAFPYRFFGLEQPLGHDVDASVANVRSWFHAGDALFRFGGARLLSAVFLGFPEPLATRLQCMAENGSDDDLSFILAVMQNYYGEPLTHPVLQAVVNRLPENDPRLVEVDIAMQNTDGVFGQFGMVESLRKKKEEAGAWIDDSRPKVKAFAENYRRRIDELIAREQRAAEQKHELRKRSFEADGELDK